MGHRVLKQPDGRYAIFSTVVNGMIVTDADATEIEDYYAGKAAEEARDDARRAIERADSGKHFQPGVQSWEEAVEIHNKHWPEDPL